MLNIAILTWEFNRGKDSGKVAKPHSRTPTLSVTLPRASMGEQIASIEARGSWSSLASMEPQMLASMHFHGSENSRQLPWKRESSPRFHVLPWNFVQVTSVEAPRRHLLRTSMEVHGSSSPTSVNSANSARACTPRRSRGLALPPILQPST